MANKAKATSRSDRRATIEAMRRQQQAQERRKTILFVSIAAILGLVLIGLAAVPAILRSVNDPTKKAPASFGVPAAAAACDPTINEAPEGSGEHVPEGERVDYAAAPPASGRHDGDFILGARSFYERGDRPAVEKLVHSLEHGYTVVWYDTDVAGDQIEALRGLAQRMDTEPAARGKFIVAPWTSSEEGRQALPEGKNVALTHWGATQAFRQYCGSVSGEAVAAFVQAHPASDAPEPNAA
ncbi:MAG: DUF3105 domain-containing protein [Actinomycetota bacterium]|nr:DUF3105 domain-containing protein [Actinomycetota bacterium]